MRRIVAITLVLVALSVAFLGGVGLMTERPNTVGDARANDEVPMVAFEGRNSTFWPYLSTFEGFQKRSPVNVIVLDATLDEVVALMQETGWNRTTPEERDAVGGLPGNDAAANATEEGAVTGNGGTGIAWGAAKGADRFALLSDGHEAQWVAQQRQLNDGPYFGNRFHVRLYGSPVPGEWVILQVHTEHFDWFTLRHAVQGVATGQRHVEADFLDQPFVREVWRKHLGHAGASDSDGWATVIELAAFLSPLVVGLVVHAPNQPGIRDDLVRYASRLRTRITLDHWLLAAAVVGIVLGVRSAGVLLDEHAPQLSVRTIAALLYPVLVAGVPLFTYGVAHRIEHRMDAAITAAFALGLASLVDYALLGIDVLPVNVLVHRVGLVFALGMIAGGAAKRAHRQRHVNELVAVGASLWILLAVAALAGWW